MAVKGDKITRTREYGTWRWNDELLWSKVGESDSRGCKVWLGARGPHCGLFGAVRNGRPQMTQARRLLLMSQNHPDMETSSVRMRCNNDYCVNTDHMYTEPNRRLGLHTDRHVEPGYTETRIGYHKWQSIAESQRQDIKDLAKYCEAQVHFDHQFMYYSITWSTYGWFKAKLKDPNTTDLLTVVYRKAE